MRQIDLEDANTHLSRLVAAAAKGESFVIAKAGKPMVKVVPVDHVADKRRIGFMEAEIDLPDDFDRLSEDEIARLFGGNDEPRS